MGRHCGDLAVYSSIAEAAELTISYGHKTDEKIVFKKLRKLKLIVLLKKINICEGVCFQYKNICNIEYKVKSIQVNALAQWKCASTLNAKVNGSKLAVGNSYFQVFP
jgi:6-phosphofructokinase